MNEWTTDEGKNIHITVFNMYSYRSWKRRKINRWKKQMLKNEEWNILLRVNKILGRTFWWYSIVNKRFHWFVRTLVNGEKAEEIWYLNYKRSDDDIGKIFLDLNSTDQIVIISHFIIIITFFSFYIIFLFLFLFSAFIIVNKSSVTVTCLILQLFFKLWSSAVYENRLKIKKRKNNMNKW